MKISETCTSFHTVAASGTDSAFLASRASAAWAIVLPRQVEDRARAYSTYVSYCGTYAVEEGTVVHHELTWERAVKRA